MSEDLKDACALLWLGVLLLLPPVLAVIKACRRKTWKRKREE